MPIETIVPLGPPPTPPTLEELAALQREIYETNKSKGWHDEPLRDETGTCTTRVLAKVALIHSELVEAEAELYVHRLEIWYADEKPDKPEGWIVELADVVIRSIDTCAALGIEAVRVPDYRPCKRAYSLHSYAAKATESARVGDYKTFQLALGGLICELERDAQGASLDLWDAVRLKLDYNKTRPHKHGGKLA